MTSRIHFNSRQSKKRPGFALVITLIMVVLAAIIVVAFLTNTSLDRTTAASVTDRYKAELAAQSGLEAAKQALFAYPTPNPGGAPEGNPRTQNDHFIVTSSIDPNGVPYFFVGCSQDPSNSGTPDDYTKPSIEYFPLYSGGKLQSGLTITGGAAPIPALTLAAGTVAMQKIGSNTTYYPLLFSSTPHSTWQPNIRTNWQPILTPAGSTTENYRFTYWIEDLSAYVDANVAGNADNSGTHIRSFGYAPKEVALFSLFSPASQFDPGTTYAKTLVQNHQLFFTRLTTRLGTTTPSSDNTVCMTSLTANLQNDGEQTLIPFGLGYKNQGQLKTNVNTVITNSPNDTGVTQVAKAISDNLPNFASSRQGSLSDDYDKTIAANIIGYGSATNTPLVGTGYRGITLMPFVTEVFEMYYWAKAYYQKTPGGTYFVDIEVKTYVQLWNMFNQDITSGTLTFTDKLTAGLKFGSSGISSFDKGTQSSPNTVSIAFTSSSPLKSNEYRPVLASDITYTIDTGSTVLPTGSIDISDHLTPTSSATDQDSSYTVSWNGVVYDRPGLKAGSHLAIERNATSLTAPAAVKIVGTVPALRYTKTSGNAPYLLGDPRMSYYINGTQYTSSYNGGTAWGGAVYMKTLVENSGWIAGESRVNGWADGGHNSTRGVTPTKDPTTLSQDPTTVNPNPTIDATKAPARSSNRPDGRIYSITELGYIYDPFQWNPFATVPTTTATVDSGWQGTWKAKFKNFPTAKTGDDDTYGSHSTLRMGRPEHKSFDQPGTRAWQLLDIFSAGDPADSTSSGGISNQIRTRGRININTASSEVLRALAAGVQIGNLTLPSGKDVDPAIQPTTVYGPQTSNAADVFSADVIAQRNKQPFLSTSQLAALPGSNSEPFFGNPDQWPSNGPTEWNDAAAEEYFAKIFNFTTVRSRNFRVFVTGQYVDPNSNDPSTGQPPRVIATANKVYEVFLKPTRDSTGKILTQNCQVTYAADLPQ